MATQAHHLIPNNVADTHPLFRALAAGNTGYDRATLDLPDKAASAANARSALAGDPLDTAHEGRHYKAYDNLVRAYLNEFQRVYTEPFTDSQGRLQYRLKAGVNPTTVFNDLKSLEVRLADWHNVGTTSDGRQVTGSQVILNGADPRIGSGPGKVSAQEAVDRLDRLDYGDTLLNPQTLSAPETLGHETRSRRTSSAPPRETAFLHAQACAMPLQTALSHCSSGASYPAEIMGTTSIFPQNICFHEMAATILT